MARIRTIKPEFFQSEALASRSAHARLLAIALLQLVDSEGRMRWIPMQAHAHAFPFEPEINIEALITDLEEIGYFQRYEVDGKWYAHVPGFTTHQRLSGKEAAMKSQHPAPPGEAHKKGRGKSRRFPGKPPDAQEQGTGNREREQETATTRPASPSADSVEHEQAATAPPPEPTPVPAPPVDPPTIVTRPGTYTLHELADAARTKLGLGTIGYGDQQANHALLMRWLYGGSGKRDPLEIMLAIEGAADMRDRDLIGWDSARPGMAMTLRALDHAATITSQGDGTALRTLYDVAIEHRRRMDEAPQTRPTARTSGAPMHRVNTKVPA